MVVVLNDHTPPEGYEKVDVDLNTATIRGVSIHLYYKVSEKPTKDELKTASQDLAIEYGHASVVPFGWEKIAVDLNSGNHGTEDGFGEPTFLFIRRGYTGIYITRNNMISWRKFFRSLLQFVLELPKVPRSAFNKDGDFKILQLADLSFHK